MHRTSHTLLLVGGVATALACQTTTSDQPDAGPGPVIATWSGDSITAAEVRAELAKLPVAALTDPDRKREVVDRMIASRLLLQEGRRRGYETDPEIVRQVDALRERLVVQRVMRDLRAVPTVSEEEARRYYEENVSLYSSTRVRASHILLEDESTAKAVYAEAAANPDRFAELAREHSTDQTSAKRGGDLGAFATGRMVPEFERAAFGLATGEVGPPVRTRYGWHVIRVTERHEGETRPFDAVKGQISSLLANRKIEAQVDAAIRKLRAAARIRVDEHRLAALEPSPDVAPTPHRAMGGH